MLLLNGPENNLHFSLNVWIRVMWYSATVSVLERSVVVAFVLLLLYSTTGNQILHIIQQINMDIVTWNGYLYAFDYIYRCNSVQCSLPCQNSSHHSILVFSLIYIPNCHGQMSFINLNVTYLRIHYNLHNFVIKQLCSYVLDLLML